MGKYEVKIVESTDTEMNLQGFLTLEATDTVFETSKIYSDCTFNLHCTEKNQPK